MDANIQPGTDRVLARFRAKARTEMLRLPGVRYLEYLNAVSQPDLTSTVLIEIPAYRDPEIVSTVLAARAMAANPDRLHFAVCYQDDDPEKLEALYAVPNCKIKYYASDEAPGLCAARYECQKLYDGEDFVFHIDSHMRFARFWDVAMIDQWRMCGSEKAVLSDYAKAVLDEDLDLPVDDVSFTKDADAGYCGVLNASFFTDNIPELRIRVHKLFPSDRPLPGAFISGHCMFARPIADQIVPNDPQMDFVADEHAVAARLWTHGFDLYQSSVRCIFHLYNRTRTYGDKFPRSLSSNRTPEGISRHERQARRLEKLFGMYDRLDIDLSGFDLGTERSLADYQEFSGVDFRNLAIREFAAHGRFDIEHGPEDMAFYDWVAYCKENHGWSWKTDKDLGLKARTDAVDGFMAMCAERHILPQAALTEALRSWTDNRRRCRFCR